MLCHETKRGEPPPQSPLLVTGLECGGGDMEPGAKYSAEEDMNVHTSPSIGIYYTAGTT